MPIEISSTAIGRRLPITLAPEGSTPPNMVRVAGGEFGVGVAKPVVLPDFWLDKYEVTNREFKRFVDAGGYRDRKFWKEPFQQGDRVLGFDEAIARFRDLTGRPGPASWELGSYPAGQDDFPVAGISWFEAAAFAEFVGKSLPTLYHWYRAANVDELSSDILRLSNFDGQRSASRWRERRPWSVGHARHGRQRQGMVHQPDARGPRSVTSSAAAGMNRAINSWNPTRRIRGDARHGLASGSSRMPGPSVKPRAPIRRVYGDPKTVVPASDAQVEGYRRFYRTTAPR